LAHRHAAVDSKCDRPRTWDPNGGACLRASQRAEGPEFVHSQATGRRIGASGLRSILSASHSVQQCGNCKRRRFECCRGGLPRGGAGFGREWLQLTLHCAGVKLRALAQGLDLFRIDAAAKLAEGGPSKRRRSQKKEANVLVAVLESVTSKGCSAGLTPLEHASGPGRNRSKRQRRSRKCAGRTWRTNAAEKSSSKGQRRELDRRGRCIGGIGTPGRRSKSSSVRWRCSGSWTDVGRRVEFSGSTCPA
jgi:hypothetical protein